jgi:hypothetical protein
VAGFSKTDASVLLLVDLRRIMMMTRSAANHPGLDS